MNPAAYANSVGEQRKAVPDWTPLDVIETQLVEARGFEPRSETRFTTASTCVSHRLRSPYAGQWAAHGWTSLLKFRRPPEGVTADYPEFAIPLKTPQASFFKGRCSNC